MIIDLTEEKLFSGLYESIWINHEEETEVVNAIASDLNIEPTEISYLLVGDFQSYLEKIGEDYIEELENFLKHELAENEEMGVLTVNGVWSPKFYNYDTDHIYLSWVSDIGEERQRDLIDLFKDDFEEIYFALDGDLLTESFAYFYDDRQIYYDNEKERYVLT